MSTYLIQLKNSLRRYVVGLRRLAIIEIIKVLVPGVNLPAMHVHPAAIFDRFNSARQAHAIKRRAIPALG